MARKKFTVEFLIRSSPAILFEFLTEPSILAQWFSDSCEAQGETYTFGWNGSPPERATIVEWIEPESVKYRWDKSPAGEFFSFRIYKSEISNDTVLEITDFAEENEIKDQQNLWNSQIEEMRHHIGA